MDNRREDILWAARQEVRACLDLKCLEVWDKLPTRIRDGRAIEVWCRYKPAADVAEEFMKEVYTFNVQMSRAVFTLGLLVFGSVAAVGALFAVLMF